MVCVWRQLSVSFPKRNPQDLKYLPGSCGKKKLSRYLLRETTENKMVKEYTRPFFLCKGKENAALWRSVSVRRAASETHVDPKVAHGQGDSGYGSTSFCVDQNSFAIFGVSGKNVFTDISDNGHVKLWHHVWWQGDYFSKDSSLLPLMYLGLTPTISNPVLTYCPPGALS